MQLKLTAMVVAAGLILAACESPSEEGAASTSAGDTTAPTVTATLPPEGVQIEPGIRNGSKEEFVAIGDRVHFGFDRYDLNSFARQVLERQSLWLKRYSSVNVTIAGHADERGTREYNLALGERRANSVKNYLIALGIRSGRVRTISYGKERPVDPGSSEDAWSKNRRGVSEVDGATVSSN